MHPWVRALGTTQESKPHSADTQQTLSIPRRNTAPHSIQEGRSRNTKGVTHTEASFKCAVQYSSLAC